MAESVVHFVLERVHELLTDEANFLSDIRDQVTKIQRELKLMKCFLKDADARQSEDEMICMLVSELREIALDAEDVLETYVLKVQLRHNGGILGRYAGKLREGINLHLVGSEIQDVAFKISNLRINLRTYGIKSQGDKPSSESGRRNELRRSYSYLVEKDFVGLEKDVEDLVALLTNQDADKGYHCQAVSICGMGGIGKTTLARRIYHHRDIRDHFDAFAWVCITHQWQEKDVLQGILANLAPEMREHINNMRQEQLMKELYKVQQRQKCLVVLDDVWSADFWDRLGPAFSKEDTNSKILLTTRNVKVSEHKALKCFLHMPRYLNEEESWELLRKKAFPGFTGADFIIHDEMEKLGRQMVGQCGGLPLAIIILGGILMSKSKITEWVNVKENLDLYLKRTGCQGEYGRVYEVLALSYQDLPYHLKPCFLYLGNFPDGVKIRTSKLFQLWAAEGFIPLNVHHRDEEKSMTNVAEHYIGELAQRCMVEVQVDESTGRIKSCRLHDLMRDVCISKGKEENFLKIIPIQHGHKSIDPSLFSAMSTNVVRRLSIIVDSNFERSFPPDEDVLDHVRSALFFTRLALRKPLQPALDLVCSEFKLLRVLDLERFSFGEKLPKAIGNLVHLRYLSLKDSEFKKLPSSIGKLKYLQTLNLDVHFFSYLIMPDVIWKLPYLRHLYLPPSHRNTHKLQLRSLSKLESLKNFDTQVANYRDLFGLTNLRKVSAILSLELDELEEVVNYLTANSIRLRESSFRIYYKFYSQKEVTLLGKLLLCDHLHKLDLIGYMSKFPELDYYSLSLIKLTLRGTELKEDPMPTLEKLPKLNTLSFRGSVFTGKEMCCSAGGFPQLKTLKLQGLPSLEMWRVQEGALPNLLLLEIDGCKNLNMVPDGFEFLTTIQELLIVNMSEAFKCRLQEVQGIQKSHIPFISVFDTTKYPTSESENHISAQNIFGLLKPVYPRLVPRTLQSP